MLKSDYLDPIWYALIWTDLKTAFFCCFGTTQNPNLRFNYRCQNSEQKIDLLNCYCDYRSKNIAKNLRFFTLISWQLIILLVPLLSTMGFFFRYPTSAYCFRTLLNIPSEEVKIWTFFCQSLHNNSLGQIILHVDLVMRYDVKKSQICHIWG